VTVPIVLGVFSISERRPVPGVAKQITRDHERGLLHLLTEKAVGQGSLLRGIDSALSEEYDPDCSV
jgi:hypothetical protein